MAVEEPRNTEELIKQINDAIFALRQWVDAANIQSSEDSVMIEAQIYWLEQLLKLARIELKK